MKEVFREKQVKNKKSLNLILLGISLAIAVILLLIFPDKQTVVTRTAWNFLVEMLQILPAVMVLMGLFAIFVPNKLIVKYLGSSSGIKGVLLALLIGALPTGPLYVAFPMASALLKKGARISNIIIFLSAWACIKIPQELMELQFLGAYFMALRLSLTILFVIAMGAIIEKIMLWSKN